MAINSYLEILLWTISIYILAMSIIHFVSVTKESDEKKRNTLSTKAIVYLAGGLTLFLLMVYKPFAGVGSQITSKLSKILRPKVSSGASDIAILSTTSMMGATTVSV